jgi:hypothetical protein
MTCDELNRRLRNQFAASPGHSFVAHGAGAASGAMTSRCIQVTGWRFPLGSRLGALPPASRSGRVGLAVVLPPISELKRNAA